MKKKRGKEEEYSIETCGDKMNIFSWGVGMGPHLPPPRQA